MYKIKIGNKTLADSASERLSVVSANLSREVNKCGAFVFTITADHPLYNEIETRTSIITVDQDNKTVFEGVAVSEEVDFYKQKTITCEGSLTFLNDSVQRQARYQGVTVRQYLEAVVSAHNSQVDTFKRFTVGSVTVTDPNNSIYRFTNYENTMECIQNDLVDSLGGYLRIRLENGTRYLDYLADSPRTNSQQVRIGKNLLDLAVNLDSSGIATVVVPLGATIEGEQDVEGLDKRVDIKSVNSGKDYLENAEAISNFGKVTKVVIFDDVTVPANLKTKGQQFLTDSQFEKMVIEASAFDLSLSDSDIMEFELLDKIRVVSAPHGLDRDFVLSAISYDLNQPENAKITLGIETDLKLTARTALMEYTANELPERVLSQAAANASALIKSSGAGNVYFDYDENGVIKQILIMDTNDKATATKVWRWNANGLGYSSTGYNGTYDLAMTIDGAFVADFITAGTLDASKVNVTNLTAQKITVGGGGNVQTALTTAQNTANSANEKIDNLEIGGRNLVIGSSTGDASSSLGWSMSGFGGSFANGTISDRKYRLTSIGGWETASYNLQNYVGKELTISFDAILVAKNGATEWSLGIANSASSRYPYTIVATNPRNNEWIHIEHTFTLNSTGLIGIGCFSAPDGGRNQVIYDIKNLKIEVGNKATDWTPAPEDVETELKKRPTEAGVVEIIDGTVNADYVNALGITASSIRVGSSSVTGQAMQNSINAATNTANAAYNGVYHTFDGTNENDGYVAFAEITILSAYANSPISLEITSRNKSKTAIKFAFVNATVSDPALSFIVSDTGNDGNGTPVWMQKTAASKWRLIAKKLDRYDSLQVVQYQNPAYNNGKIDLTWTNTAVPSLPTSNITAAVSELGYDGYTTINGGNIKTGVIQSSDNTKNFELNMLTGLVKMKSAEITGGHINIESNDQGDSQINLGSKWTIYNDEEGDYLNNEQSIKESPFSHRLKREYWFSTTPTSPKPSKTFTQELDLRPDSAYFLSSFYNASGSMIRKNLDIDSGIILFSDENGNGTRITSSLVNTRDVSCDSLTVGGFSIGNLICSTQKETGSGTTVSFTSTKYTRHGFAIIVGDGNGETVFCICSFHNNNMVYNNLGTLAVTPSVSFQNNTATLTVTARQWSDLSVISNQGYI